MSYFDDVIQPRIDNGSYYTKHKGDKMTKQYDNTNRAALFRNDKKTDEKHADFNGTLNVDGKEYWINMWENTGNGPAFRASIKPKEVTNLSIKAQAPTAFDDDGNEPF